MSEAFKKLTVLNTGLLLNNISQIDLPTGETVSDPAEIKEFVDNAPAKLSKELEEKYGKVNIDLKDGSYELIPEEEKE